MTLTEGGNSEEFQVQSYSIRDKKSVFVLYVNKIGATSIVDVHVNNIQFVKNGNDKLVFTDGNYTLYLREKTTNHEEEA